MQLGNAVATRANEEKWKYSVYETSRPPHQHAQPKRARCPQVLEIGFAYRGRMLCEEPPVFHIVASNVATDDGVTLWALGSNTSAKDWQRFCQCATLLRLVNPLEDLVAWIE
jgi:hypothetical protein